LHSKDLSNPGWHYFTPNDKETAFWTCAWCVSDGTHRAPGYIMRFKTLNPRDYFIIRRQESPADYIYSNVIAGPFPEWRAAELAYRVLFS